MMELMRQAWDLTDSDPGIRVCVLTGAGGAFCAGADLKAMTREHPGARLGELDLSVIEPLLKGRRLSKPLIAAVEGPAIAGGTEILQACDIRVAGASARFGVSEARWGLFPLGGSAVRLPRQIPYTVAADLLLTGRHITAAEALSIGLIGHVVPDGQALGQGAGDRGGDRGQRAGRGAGDPAGHPGDRGHGGERGVRARGQGGHGRVRQRGRQGGPARVRREAAAGIPRPVASGVVHERAAGPAGSCGSRGQVVRATTTQ